MKRLPIAPGGRPMTPLQAELLEEGQLPDPDPLGAELARPDLAPGAGYGDGGPSPLAGPGDQVEELLRTVP